MRSLDSEDIGAADKLGPEKLQLSNKWWPIGFEETHGSDRTTGWF